MKETPERAPILHVGELELRLHEGLVLARGKALRLSVREFGLLVALVGRAGGIVSREELYRAVWERDLRAGDRSVDVYVSKLRVKLEAAIPDSGFIHTHPGFGYRFEQQPLSEADTPPSTRARGRSASSNGGARQSRRLRPSGKSPQSSKELS